MKNKSSLSVFCVTILYCLVYLNGCIDPDKIKPVKVDHFNNAFRPADYWKGGEVNLVEVWEYSEKTERCVWKIKSEESILADDFIVQIGVIPNGFVQIVPETSQIFIPESGNKYYIYIRTTNWGTDIAPIATFWTAK